MEKQASAAEKKPNLFATIKHTAVALLSKLHFRFEIPAPRHSRFLPTVIAEAFDLAERYNADPRVQTIKADERISAQRQRRGDDFAYGVLRSIEEKLSS